MATGLQSYQYLPRDEIELQRATNSAGDEQTKKLIERGYLQTWWHCVRSRSDTKDPSLNTCLRVANIGLHGAVISVIGGLVACLIVLSTSRSFYVSRSACLLDGTYRPSNLWPPESASIVSAVASGGGKAGQEAEYSPWGTENTFTINMNYGAFTFGNAKLIDTAWDLIVGRGGQALLAIISYRIFNQALARVMETKHVSHITFAAIAFDNSSLSAVTNIARNFYSNEGRRAKLTIFWAIISMTILLVFPTLSGAMTGYTPNFDALVTTQDGERLLLRNFQPIFYIIHDAHRLGSGWYDDFPVVDMNLANYQPIVPIYHQPATGFNTTIENLAQWRSIWRSLCSDAAPAYIDATQNITLAWESALPKCDLLWRVSEYTYQYGFSGLRNVSSVFFNIRTSTNITLPSPVLNISSHFLFFDQVTVPAVPYCDNVLAWAVLPYAHNWRNASGNSAVDYRNLKSPTFYKSNESSRVFSIKDIEKNGTCQQQGPGSEGAITYAWGFSVQLLIALLAMILAWTLGMYSLYLETHLNGNRTILQRGMGLQRAVLDLADEYRKEINNDDVSAYSNKQLRELIGNSSMSYIELAARMPASDTLFRRFLKSRFMSSQLWERYWWGLRRLWFRIGIPVGITVSIIGIVVTLVVVCMNWASK